MKVCILRSYLGSDRHLLLDTAIPDVASWVRSVPDDSWALGTTETNHPRDLRVLAQYAGLTIDWEVPERFRHADEESNTDSSRFIQTVPRDVMISHIRGIRDKAESLEMMSHDSYINSNLVVTRRQLGSIREVRIDPRVWSESTQEDNSPALQSFEPNADGLADAVVYDQLGSLTGRLTVRSGPQILTLRRDMRQVMRATRRGRRLLMADFVSHEPRVALCLDGGDPPLDIYGWFKEEVMPGVTRDAAKNAIISTLYGMSPSTLSEKLDCTLVEAKIVNERVRVTFGLDKLEKELIRVHKNAGSISSAFGRKIKPSSASPGVLVNSYIQSTAYDIAMAGFRQILDMCAASLIETFVFFYIHDAMIFEIPERDEDRLRRLLSVPISIPGCPGRYWLKIKEVTE